MASNEKAKVHARKNNRERQGGGNQQKWTWSKTLIENSKVQLGKIGIVVSVNKIAHL